MGRDRELNCHINRFLLTNTSFAVIKIFRNVYTIRRGGFIKLSSSNWWPISIDYYQ